MFDRSKEDTKEFKEKMLVVSKHYGPDLWIIVRLNAIYDVLKKKGIFSDEELYHARINDINELYEQVTAMHQQSATKSRWLNKSNPLSWF